MNKSLLSPIETRKMTDVALSKVPILLLLCMWSAEQDLFFLLLCAVESSVGETPRESY